jgi:hypothetical protein
LGDFSEKSSDFAQKYLRNAPWTKVKTWLILLHFHKLSEYCNFEITHWGKRGLLVIQKTIIFTGKSFTDFRQKSVVFCPKMTNKIHKPCLGHQK